MSDCKCVKCGSCGGTGNVEYDTGSYPEWDLDMCEECSGSGISELCAECELARELEEWVP